MLIKKLMLAAFALSMLACAWLRPVYDVEIDGARIPGAWTRADIDSALRSAAAAAEEIARGDEGLPVVTTGARLTLLPASGDESRLALDILAGTEGVERGWDVYVDGARIGRAADESALGEVLMASIAEAVPPESVRTGFSSDVALVEVYAPDGSCTELATLARSIRSLVRVAYTTPDGEVHYA